MKCRRLREVIAANLTRALLIALPVGTLLILINHGDHLGQEPVCQRFFAKCALSYAVPFGVSVTSALLAARSGRAARDRTRSRRADELTDGRRDS